MPQIIKNTNKQSENSSSSLLSSSSDSSSSLTRHGYVQFFQAGPQAQLSGDSRAEMLQVSEDRVEAKASKQIASSQGIKEQLLRSFRRKKNKPEQQPVDSSEVVKLSELVDGAGTHIEIIKSKEPAQYEQLFIAITPPLIAKSISKVPEEELLKKYQGLASMRFISAILFNPNDCKFITFGQAASEENLGKVQIDIRGLKFDEKQKLINAAELEKLKDYTIHLISSSQRNVPVDDLMPMFRAEFNAAIFNVMGLNEPSIRNAVTSFIYQYKFKGVGPKAISNAIQASAGNPALTDYQKKHDRLGNYVNVGRKYTQKEKLDSYSAARVMTGLDECFESGELIKSLDAKTRAKYDMVLDDTRMNSLPEVTPPESSKSPCSACRVRK
jgi:hypothetical protein